MASHETGDARDQNAPGGHAIPAIFRHARYYHPDAPAQATPAKDAIHACNPGRSKQEYSAN
jgi:hypothetical protein